jgi:transposase-like protein
MLVELGLVEQRYKAVCEVLDGANVTEVARTNGVARQTVRTWLRRCASLVKGANIPSNDLPPFDVPM